MKVVIIAAIATWVLFLVFGIILPPRDHRPGGKIGKLLEQPHRSIENPYRNGYFYLFGLTAPASLDPAKAGYEVWVEESRGAGREKEDLSRADLSLTVLPSAISTGWKTDDPLSEFQKQASALHPVIGQQQLLLTRYEHWLELPFEDWGFGRRLTPCYQDIMSIHRLYIAEGFSLGMLEGMERLRKELQFARLMLREAKAIGTKMMAQVLINDDLHLLSRIFAKPIVNQDILAMGLQLTQPLSNAEYSLRWPIRNQLALVIREIRGRAVREEDNRNRDNVQYEWLARESGLPPRAFDGIEHPIARSMFNITLESAQAWNTYATYYDALITASESKAKGLPGMRDATKMVQPGIVESLLNSHPIEPDWGIFYHKLMETDARLRLASLQIQLRRPSAQQAVPARLAEVGSHYFDPFTGLPMLWSPTQQKLYSAGKDQLDDGGDPTFDISVPAIVTNQLIATKRPPQFSRRSHVVRR
jgi:hypothetical protein